MTTLQPSPPTPARRLARSDLYLAAMLASVVLVLATMAVEASRGASQLPASRWLALIPLALAAYSRRGLWIALVLSAFFASALLPAVLAAWGTPALIPMLLDVAAYGVLLGVMAYLAATVADFLRTRQALSGAVRDWEALLARAAELRDVVSFVVHQAALMANAGSAALLLLNPLDGQWEAISVQGEVLQRFPMADGRRELALAQWLVDQGRPLILNDLPDDRRFSAPLAGAGRVVHSLLAQPLVRQDGAVLAMLVLMNKHDGPFTNADFTILAELVAAGARAIEQAGQYALADYTLARRVQQLAALQRSARELNATIDPQAIVDETMACAITLSGAEVGLVSVDVPNLAPAYRTWNVTVASDTVQRAAELAREASHAMLVSAHDDSFYSLQAQPGRRLVVPIRREQQTLGLILVESSLPQAFGEEALRSVASLADHAAAALENARLFRQVMREKEKSDEIIDTIADALFTTDSDGRVTGFNPAAEALTGWRTEEAIGHSVCEVLGRQQESDHIDPCPFVLALREGRRLQESQWVIRQRMGLRRLVALSAAPLPAGDGAVVLMRDVTEALELERMQRELIAAFSHELRTPLTNIGMITEMMLDGGERVDEVEREQLHLLQTQSRRLEAFADRILEVSRLETGALALDLRPLPLNLLLSQVAQQWRGVWTERDLRLSLSDQTLWVWADEHALHSVLNTLLENASKYTPAGSLIELSAWQDQPGFATVAVDDHGPGIAPAHQSHVFDRFFRVDNQDSQRVYGHGLGLYIARTLVEQMGGQIWLESEEGLGSRFALSLPLMTEGFDEDFGD